ELRRTTRRRSMVCMFFFFFSSRRRHTRSKRDWSSDVCSSDLIGDMVQAGTTAVGDGEVVDVALAVHPGGRDAAVVAVLLGIFGEAEAEPGVEIDGVLHFGGEHVEMVEPLRMAALVEIVAPQQMRTLLHRGVELDLEAERIGELQRAALERLLDEGV